MRLSKRERILRFAAWLKEHYPVAYPVQVRFVKDLRDSDGERIFGHSYRVGRKLFVDLHTHLSLWSTAEVLAHEWAHLVHLPFDRLEYRKIRLRPHEPATGWCVTYGSIYSDFNDKPVRFKL